MKGVYLMIKASILGATGYVGAELVRLLYGHPNVEIAHLVSASNANNPLSSIYENLAGLALPKLESLNIDAVCHGSDVLFVSLPHGASKDVIPALYATGKKIIDMSGDFRYDDPAVYSKWYGVDHDAPELLKKAVYGLPELHREAIKSAQLIGNPGCYTTCSILALAPLLKAGAISTQNIIIDAKSGATGAGRNPSQALHFCEVDSSVKAYNVGTHRHTSEIEQELSKIANSSILLSFTPHLLPIKRGILATSYANLTTKADDAELISIFKEFYAKERFITVFDSGKLPEIKHVVGSNQVAIGLVVDVRLNRVVVVSCIDNLMKGAAGQAVQNLNILFGLDEKTGLDSPAWYL